MDIQILEVHSPGSFLAREIAGPRMSLEMQAYQAMDQEIQNYCESSQYVDIHVLAPEKGQMYLAKKTDEHEHEAHWYRCIVKTVLRTSGGAKASCYLIDRVQTILVSHTHMREIPEKFRKVPCQVQEFSLAGVQPITMSVNFMDGAEMKPTQKWDTAACEYFERLIKGKALQCQVTCTDEEGVRHTMLYVKHQGDLLNVNNILVKKSFACRVEGTNIESPGCSQSFHTTSQGLETSPNTHGTPRDGAFSQPESTRGLPASSPRLTSPAPSQHSRSSLSPSQPFILPRLKTPSPIAAMRTPSPHSPRDAGVVSPHSVDRTSPRTSPAHLMQSMQMRLKSPPPVASSDNTNMRATGERTCNEQLCGSSIQATGTVRIGDSGSRGSDTTGGAIPKSCHRSPQQGGPPSCSLNLQSLSPALVRQPMRQTSDASSGTAIDANPGAIRSMSASTCSLAHPGTISETGLETASKDSLLPMVAPNMTKQSIVGASGDFGIDPLEGNASTPTQSPVPSESPASAGRGSVSPMPKLSPMERRQQMLKSLEQAASTTSSAFSIMTGMRMGGTPINSGRKGPNEAEQLNGGGGDQRQRNVESSPGDVPSSSEEGGYSSHDEVGHRENAPQTGDEAASQSSRTPFLLSSTKLQASLSKQLLSLHEKSLLAPTIPSPLKKRILIHGERPPKLIMDIKTSPFPEKLKQYLGKFGHPGLTLIQSACWAAISRGRDVMGVAPREQNVSLGFLAPLVAQMMQSSYSELPAGHGPISLIVCSSWQRALHVYQQCLCLNGNNTIDRLKAVLLHAGGSEEEQKVKLLKGAPIVIGTLPCILRLAGSCHVHLNRLFHLIIDEADSLFEHQLEAVKHLMVRFRTVLRASPKRSTLRQLMVFSSKWTIAMGSYLRTYLADPLVIITDPLEMAVYGRAPQKLILIHPSKRVNILLEKLNSGLNEAGKVMVFTSTRETARDMVKILKCSSCFTLLAAGEMLVHQLEEIRYEWQTGHRSDSQPVLVVSDDCVEDLELQDASCIIHYDLPSSKVKYGRRMACLKEHYAAQIEESVISSCQAMTFVTPECYHHLYSLLHVIKRSGQQLPEEITLNRAMEYRDEHRSTRPLCHSIKSFGFCRQVSSCASRHFINPNEDQPGLNPQYMNLPHQGQVKILVMHVVDAVTFYARIIKYQPSVEAGTIPINQLRGNPQLNVQLSRWFSNSEKCTPVMQPVIGKLYATQDSKKSIHRVLAQRWVKDRENQEEKRVQVKFVDEGRTETLLSYKLLDLPKTFRSIPYQAVEVIACGAMPPDKENNWTTQANMMIHNLVHGEELEGKVVLSLGNTMWLDPVVQRIKVPDLKNLINRVNVRVDITEGGYGVANPLHIKRVKELCSGRIELEQDETLTRKRPETVILEPHYDCLTVGETPEVYLSAIGSPRQFSVQKVGISDKLGKLMTEINRDDAVEMRLEEAPDWSVGDLCLAKFPTDERWYRGKITELGDEYEVVFIDHGDQETVPPSDLKPMPNHLLKLPFAAIDCTMPHVSPKDGGDIWTSEAADEIWALCNEGADKNIISVKVLSQETNDDIGGGDKRYSTELLLFTDGKQMAISSMLFKKGLVNLEMDRLAEILMPVSHLKEKDDATELMKTVCQQCHKIFNSQNAENTFQLSQELYQQVLDIRNLPESSDAASSVQDAIVAICRLLNHQDGLSDKSRVLITEGLLMLVNTDWGNAKVVVDEGCLPSLCLALCQMVDPDIRHRIFWLFNIFPTKKLLSVSNFTQVLFDVFITVPSPSIQVSCLQLMIKQWQREDIKALLPVPELITAICNILWGYPIESLISECIKMLQLLVGDEEAVAMMRREKLGHSLQCLSLSKTIPVDGEAYRLIMGMSDIFDADSDIGSMGSDDEFRVARIIPSVDRHEESRDSDEGTSVDGPLPARCPSGLASSERETSSNTPEGSCFLTGATPPPPLLDEQDQFILHPQVRWSQRSNSVLISVQLRGVSTFILEVTSLSIEFSTLYDDTQYEFDFELCNRVDPDNYSSRATGHEVLITLYKEGVGVNWPRLTSSKLKLPYLSVDCERWKEEDEFGYDSEAATAQNKMRVVTDPHITHATIPELIDSTDSSSTDSEDDGMSSSSWSDSESCELGLGKAFVTGSDSQEVATD